MLLGHSLGLVEPSGQNLPLGQRLIDIVFGQKYFAGHRLALDDPAGQYALIGHSMGSAVPCGQFFPAGQRLIEVVFPQ